MNIKNAVPQHTLISAREALKILTFVSYQGLYHGSRGTNVLTRFPHGCYSKEECEQLRDRMIAAGISRAERISSGRREIPTELV